MNDYPVKQPETSFEIRTTLAGLCTDDNGRTGTMQTTFIFRSAQPEIVELAFRSKESLSWEIGRSATFQALYGHDAGDIEALVPDGDVVVSRCLLADSTPAVAIEVTSPDGNALLAYDADGFTRFLNKTFDIVTADEETESMLSRIDKLDNATYFQQVLNSQSSR